MSSTTSLNTQPAGGPSIKELPKTISFENVEFMSATLTGASKVDAGKAAKVTECLAGLSGKTGADAVAAATALAENIKAAGVAAFTECGVVTTLQKMLGDRATSEPALFAIKYCSEIVGDRAEPFLIPFLPNVLTAVSDKKSKEVRDAAAEAGPALIKIANPHAVKNVQPFLFAGIAETNWQTKLLALQLLGLFAERSNVPFSRTLYQVVPVVSAAMWDTKKEVKQAAKDATLQALNTCQNRDIRPFIPAVIEAIENPSEVPETLHKLSSTVFVQSVDNPALSMTVPILMRGCQEKKIESKRRVCVIADNMCKLIGASHPSTILIISSNSFYFLLIHSDSFLFFSQITPTRRRPSCRS
jgi:elongation factor 3